MRSEPVAAVVKSSYCSTPSHRRPQTSPRRRASAVRDTRAGMPDTRVARASARGRDYESPSRALCRSRNRRFTADADPREHLLEHFTFPNAATRNQSAPYSRPSQRAGAVHNLAAGRLRQTCYLPMAAQCPSAGLGIGANAAAPQESLAALAVELAHSRPNSMPTSREGPAACRIQTHRPSPME
jgi:hypothetical protein